jgi:hypothetical protein
MGRSQKRCRKRLDGSQDCLPKRGLRIQINRYAERICRCFPLVGDGIREFFTVNL